MNLEISLPVQAGLSEDRECPDSYYAVDSAVRMVFLSVSNEVQVV